MKTLGSEHPHVAISNNNIGLIWDSKGDYDKALGLYEKCLVIKLKKFGSEHLDVATSYDNIGGIFDSKGDYDKALENYEKCLAIQIKTYEEKDLESLYVNIGEVLLQLEQCQQAIDYILKEFGIQKQGEYAFRLAMCYEAIEKIDKAFFTILKHPTLEKKI